MYSSLMIRTWLRCLGVACAMLVAVRFCDAQESSGSTQKPATGAPDESITIELIEGRLKAIDESTEIDDGTKGKLRDLYQQARQQLEEATVHEDKARQFDQWVTTALADAEKARRELDEPLPEFDFTSATALGLSELDMKLSEFRTQLEQAKKELTDAEAESQRRATRRAEIPQAIPKSRERLANVESELVGLDTSGDPENSRLAREALLLARRQAIRGEINALEKELAAYIAQTGLLRHQRDLAARRATRLDEDVAKLGNLVNSRRKEDATAQAQQAKADIESVPKVLGEFAQSNLELAKQRLELAGKIQEVAAEFGTIRKRLSDLDEEFKRTQNRAKTDSSATLGLLMRKQRASLPDERSAQRDIAKRQRTIQEVQSDLFELEDRRTDLADIDAVTRSALAGPKLRHVAPQGDETERALRGLLLNEKQILDNLIDDTNHYFERLVDLNSEQQHLVVLIDHYADFVDEHVFWVRSCTTLSLDDAKNAIRAAVLLVHPITWSSVGEAAIIDARNNPISLGLAVVAIGLLFYYRGRLRGHVRDLATIASRRTCREFMPTFRALVLTILIALPWLLLAWCIAWRMELYPNEFARSLAGGLIVVVVSFLPLELIRQICRQQGLAETHFGWSERVLSILRSNLRALILLGVPLVLVAATLHGQDNELYHNSLGRLCFITTMVILAAILHRVFRLKGGVLHEVIASNRGGWLDRTRYIWYVAIVFMPVLFSVLALVGYYYTSWLLMARLQATALLLVGLLILGAVAYRWVLLTRRKIAFQQAQERRAQRESSEEVSTDSTLLAPEEEAVELSTIDAQTRQLIRSFLLFVGFVGVWLIWVDVLPALAVLKQGQLWATEGIDGTTRWITAADILFVALVVCIFFVVVRNVPGVTEFILLERLPVDASIRYAARTLIQYTIVLVGILVICGALGITWGKTQWLVAALGVGLGFGLQEIFANFVSGIILLFERPIRIGDIITLDNVTGVVTRIRIRATTIRNWDRQELIVPNKDLITGRLLNWTLSDTTNRIVITVGVAYGSNTRRAREVLFEILRDHPNVLEDPEPRVTFEQFADSSLNFLIRACVAKLDDRLETIHDLHTTIHERLNEEGIEIAFPQRDIHIRTDERTEPSAQQQDLPEFDDK